MLKTIILDLDGVIFLGQTIIPGVDKAIEELRKKGLMIFFLSNTSTKSRKSLMKKLVQMGVHALEKEIYSASYATAEYISKKYSNAKVYPISSGGIKKELNLKGIQIVDNENANIVAVGLDKAITYQKISIGFRAIMNGALFIAASEDPSYPVVDGLLPGAGAIVGALRFSTNKKPIVIGKPNTYMLKMIMHEHNLKRNEVLMVGDMFDIDIRMAKRAKIKSILLLSGVANKEDVKKNNKLRPDLVLNNLSELPTRLSKIQ